MRITIRINDDLLLRAKELAAEEGRTLTSIVEEGVAIVLNTRQARKTKRRVKIPIAKETGGVKPGIDLNDSAALNELMEDYDAYRR